MQNHGLPQGTQSPVVITDDIEFCGILSVFSHEGIQCKLKLGHVAGELQFPALAQWLRNGYVGNKRPKHVLNNRGRPTTNSVAGKCETGPEGQLSTHHS